MPARLGPHHVRLLALISALALIGAQVPVREAFAAPTAEDLETARSLFKRARELRAQGDLRGALEKFKAAHALGHTPITGLELARTHVLVGELVEAREACLGIARMAVEDDETARSAEAREAAAELAESLRPRIPSITLRLDGLRDGEHPVVTVDGVQVPDAALLEPRKVNPGPHVIVATLDGGRQARSQVTLNEAEQSEVTISLPPDAAPAAPTIVARSLPPGKAASSPPKSPLVWTGAGLAGVGLGVGIVTGIVAFAKAAQVRGACPSYQCASDAADDLRFGRAMGTISTIAFGVAAVGGVLLLVGMNARVSPRRNSVTTGATPGHLWIGPGGIAGTF